MFNYYLLLVLVKAVHQACPTFLLVRATIAGEKLLRATCIFTKKFRPFISRVDGEDQLLIFFFRQKMVSLSRGNQSCKKPCGPHEIASRVTSWAALQYMVAALRSIKIIKTYSPTMFPAGP